VVARDLDQLNRRKVVRSLMLICWDGPAVGAPPTD
jgi:hypothetical protein